LAADSALGVLIKSMKNTIEHKKIWRLIAGSVMILIHAYWIYYSIHLLYQYHFTGVLFKFMIPDWILLLNTILGLVGLTTGIGIVAEKIKTRNGVLIGLGLLLTGSFIQNFYTW
jgi:hypothetical protein